MLLWSGEIFSNELKGDKSVPNNEVFDEFRVSSLSFASDGAGIAVLFSGAMLLCADGCRFSSEDCTDASEVDLSPLILA